MSSDIRADLRMSFNGWLNINPPAGYIGPHSHPQALLSGSYYVDVPGDDDAVSGSIEFVCPHPVSLIDGVIDSDVAAGQAPHEAEGRNYVDLSGHANALGTSQQHIQGSRNRRI